MDEMTKPRKLLLRSKERSWRHMGPRSATAATTACRPRAFEHAPIRRGEKFGTRSCTNTGGVRCSVLSYADTGFFLQRDFFHLRARVDAILWRAGGKCGHLSVAV